MCVLLCCRSKKEHKKSIDTINIDVEELTIIRFADFILNKVVNRKIPDPLFPSDPPAAVIAKMDIENEEYSVLNDLLSDDAHLFCALTAISIEFHYYHPQSKKVMNVPGGAAQNHFKKLVEVKSLIAQALQQPDCHTSMIQYDSEDYRLDHAEGLKVLETVREGSAGVGAGGDGDGEKHLRIG
jgi:hypothetical protein